MATRPIFLPTEQIDTFVLIKNMEFLWHPGLSISQKQKSISSLHDSAIANTQFSKFLEISSKSSNFLGKNLSAFNLRFRQNNWPKCQIEQAFQSSKIFRGGGPYLDIITMTPKDAKRDPRLRNSGELIAFEFRGRCWSLEPPTAFYDWLYLNALQQNPNLAECIIAYDGFTDIEFNPTRSVNCQAHSAALFVSLSRLGLIEDVLADEKVYCEIISRAGKRQDRPRPLQGTLL